MKRALGALTLVAVLASAAGPALAAPAARLVYLRGKGAETCPDENAIKQAVAVRLGYDPFIANADMVVIAEVAREGGAFKARIKLVDEKNIVRGSRELTHPGDKCADMIDTMALSISIAIDPSSLTGPKKPETVESVEEPKQPDPPPETPAPVAEPPHDAPPVVAKPAPATEHATPFAFAAGLGALGFVGAAPAANTGGTAFVRAQYGVASVWLEGRADLAASREIDGASVSTSMMLGSLLLCAHRSVAFACGVVSLGSLRASSSGIANARSDSALHAAAGLRLGAEFPEGSRVRGFLHATGLGTLTPQVVQLDQRDVYELPRFSLGISAGVVVTIF